VSAQPAASAADELGALFAGVFSFGTWQEPPDITVLRILGLDSPFAGYLRGGTRFRPGGPAVSGPRRPGRRSR